MIHVEITAQDIKDGQPCEGDRCPIALALLRALPRGARVDVRPTDFKLRLDGAASVILRLPRSAREFVAAFDDVRQPINGRSPHYSPKKAAAIAAHVRPFAFELELDP